MTYQKLYEQGVRTLQEAEIEESALDARLLLEYVCGTDRSTLYAHPDREVAEPERERYLSLVKKRSAHVPLQHLTGEQDFMGLTFHVNEDVLIPRQDTEILVEEIMRDLHDGMRILDVCTGSGCILLSLLRYSNDTTGIGLDLSAKALAVARENAGRFGLAERAELLESDLFAVLECGRNENNIEEKFDLIVSNPPYIRTGVIETLMPEVRDHEPRMALDGMEDGLFFYRKIIAQSARYLKRGGQLFFEIGFDQGKDVAALMKQNGYIEVEVKQDYAGLDRVVYGTLQGN
jgi:release factor glutamine methyltransferase